MHIFHNKDDIGCRLREYKFRNLKFFSLFSRETSFFKFAKLWNIGLRLKGNFYSLIRLFFLFRNKFTLDFKSWNLVINYDLFVPWRQMLTTLLSVSCKIAIKHFTIPVGLACIVSLDVPVNGSYIWRINPCQLHFTLKTW